MNIFAAKYSRRIFIAFLSVFTPLALLANGIYGSFLFSFSAPLIWQVVYLGRPVSSLGLRRRSLGVSVVFGLASGIVLGLLGGKALQFFGLIKFPLTDTYSIQFAIGTLEINLALAKEVSCRLLVMSDSLKGLALYLLFMVFVVGLGEEIFWRGFIQGKIAGRVTKRAAIWITALLFALFHFYIFMIIPFKGGIILLALIGVAGAAWGYLYERTDNIWAAAISHGIAAAIVWKYYFFV